MSKKPSKTSLVFIAFKKTLNNCFPVLNHLSVKFGFYFLGFCFLILFFISVFFPHLNTVETEFFSFYGLLIYCFLIFAHVFNVFIIPYYGYKKVYGSSVPDFWDFIAKTVYPLVIAHIKATGLILLFALLFLFPGIYKKIRLSFINEAVFFDREKPGSALKKADQCARSFFWPLLLFLSFSTLLYFFSSYAVNKALSHPDLPKLLSSSVKLTVFFYLSCFILLWRTFFYFEIKTFKGEAISL